MDTVTYLPTPHLVVHRGIWKDLQFHFLQGP